jgi:hypothetical protein
LTVSLPFCIDTQDLQPSSVWNVRGIEVQG